MDLTSVCVSISQKAALAVYPYIGCQNQKAADKAAVSSMRAMFNKAPMDGVIVIGEGERDKAPMLYIGEKVGQGPPFPAHDIAVDPLEGTGLCARGEKGSLCVMALADKDSLLHAPDVYMDKLACGKKARGLLNLENPVSENIKILSSALNVSPSKLKVAVLDRPRHASLIQELKASEVDPILFGDGDVTMALLTAMEGFDESIDLLLGSGGAPEGVLCAVGLKSLGGDFQGKLLWANEEQKQRALSMGLKNLDQVFQRDALVKKEGVFIAAGVTDGPLARGVHVEGDEVFVEAFVLSAGEKYSEKKCQVIKTQYKKSDLKNSLQGEVS